MGLSLKPPKIFYGWWIVGASLLISLYVGGVIFYGFTAIFEPIRNEFGWSSAQISIAASIRGLEVGLLAPLIGILIDRWGPRRLVFSGVIFMALGLVLLSRVTSLGMFYTAFVLISIGLSGCSMTLLMTTVANWFRKKVGIASGIVISGYGLGGLLVPVIVALIDTHQWRMAMVILAFGLLALVLPLSLLFRHKPEQYGYLPDGEAKSTVKPDSGLAQSQTVEFSIGAKQALKTRAFWHISLAFTYHIMAVNAIVIHVMPYLSSIGVVRSMSSLVATAIPLTSIVGRLGFGWLGDKLNRKGVTAISFAMMCLGALCFGYAATAGIWLLVPFFILFGIGYGGSNTMRPSLIREFFGRTNFGTIFGFIMGVNMLGSMLGPPLAGWVFDTWGSYQGMWFVLVALGAAAAFTILSTPPITTAAQPIEQT